MRYVEEYQLELGFPEYEFQVGDIVEITEWERYAGIPFVIVERVFRDVRNLEQRDTDELLGIYHKLTKWYYMVRSVELLSYGDNKPRYAYRSTDFASIRPFKWAEQEAGWVA